METVKTVVVTVILMAAGYGVYVSLWRKPEKTTSDIAADAPDMPTVQMPGRESSDDQKSSVAPLGNAANAGSPLPGTSVPPPPLFGSNPRSETTSGGATGLSPGGSPGGSVTLIPGPNAEKPPIAASIPAPGDNLPAPTTPGVAKEQDDFREQYRSFIQQVQKTLDDGKLPEALRALTTFYELPNLPEPQRGEVEQLLDQLAGTVIYSRQHYLERPYAVQPGETLDQLAERCGVPALLLARINGIDPRQPLEPNRELKIFRGPFTAVVSLEKRELTLKLNGGYYAGRFPIGLGADCPLPEGVYSVLEKTPRPIYRGPDGVNFPADDGRNPLGKYWIGLGDRIGLHGKLDESGIVRESNRGAIALKDRDIDDLFGILSLGSQVVIRR
ncbi:MAG: L,D-transpeptidase family protein [Pirellulales bacterium]|nr:L,D-transpeptidase family protein [Pirellulales bacterium]